MSGTSRLKVRLISAFILCFPASFQSGAMDRVETSSGPGKYDITFPISCGAESQAAFVEGVYRLHNMMYNQAADVFAASAEKDKSCAMLHWGVAMTQFHPKWPGVPADAAMKRGANAAAEARALASTTSKPEQLYIEAVSAYYEDWKNRSRMERKVSWREVHRRLAEDYPDDDEAQILYGLSRMTTADPFDTTYAEDLAVAKILEAIRGRRPAHPGILHYLVHAYDNPVHAEKGLSAADVYSEKAPDTPHGLHMPTHIYVRIGSWEKVIAGNRRSADVALKQPVAGNKVSMHYIHAEDYRAYAALQTGNDALAGQVAEAVAEPMEWERMSGAVAYGLVAIPARIAVDRSDWATAATLSPRPVPYDWDQYPWAEAITFAARGLGAAQSQDAKGAEVALAKLAALGEATSSPWWQRRIGIQSDVIKGWMAWHDGDVAAAEVFFRKAAADELEAGKQPVEPAHVIHATEHLADFLAAAGRHDEALGAYRTALKDARKRLHSLMGAARALDAMGKHRDAEKYYEAVAGMAMEGSERPEIAEARTRLKDGA